MRRRLFLLICLATLVIVLFTTIPWAKLKCMQKCVGTNGPLCPYPVANPCQFVADECLHVGIGKFCSIPYDWTDDVYLRQCVPCNVPEEQNEPQFMQWTETIVYLCGAECTAWFATTKGKGPQEWIPVPFPCGIEVRNMDWNNIRIAQLNVKH